MPRRLRLADARHGRRLVRGRLRERTEVRWTCAPIAAACAGAMASCSRTRQRRFRCGDPRPLPRKTCFRKKCASSGVPVDARMVGGSGAAGARRRHRLAMERKRPRSATARRRPWLRPTTISTPRPMLGSGGRRDRSRADFVGHHFDESRRYRHCSMSPARLSMQLDNEKPNENGCRRCNGGCSMRSARYEDQAGREVGQPRAPDLPAGSAADACGAIGGIRGRHCARHIRLRVSLVRQSERVPFSTPNEKPPWTYPVRARSQGRHPHHPGLSQARDHVPRHHHVARQRPRVPPLGRRAGAAMGRRQDRQGRRHRGARLYPRRRGGASGVGRFRADPQEGQAAAPDRAHGLCAGIRHRRDGDPCRRHRQGRARGAGRRPDRDRRHRRRAR